MSRVALASLALAALARGAALDSPVQLLTRAGELLPSACEEISAASASAGQVTLIASVGGKARGRQLLNSLFGTCFPTSLPLADAGAVGGASVTVPSAAPGVVLIDTEGACAGEDGTSGASECTLATFSLALADAVLVHAPCARPSAGILQQEFERLFVEHLTVQASPPADGDAKPPRTMLIYVVEADADPAQQRASARGACESAWTAASTPSQFKGMPFSAFFELVPVVLPSAKFARDEYEAALADLRTTLRSLHADGFRKVAKAEGFTAAAASAWEAVQSGTGNRPSSTRLNDRYWISSAYEAALSHLHAGTKKFSTQVADGKVCAGFGASAESHLSKSLAVFDKGVADVSSDSEPAVFKQREKLVKVLQSEVRELFQKQHRTLTLNVMGSYKSALLKVAERAGNVQQYQQERLRRAAEKSFDAQLVSLLVPSIASLPSRTELAEGFSRQLTSMATKFVDSPAVQLKSIAAMRRRTSKGQKPPRGLRWGLGLTGAIRNKMGGGQGNLQSFVGWAEGLNSAHLMFANDGNIADSSGSEPPPIRLQPKLNFDISI